MRIELQWLFEIVMGIEGKIVMSVTESTKLCSCSQGQYDQRVSGLDLGLGEFSVQGGANVTCFVFRANATQYLKKQVLAKQMHTLLMRIEFTVVVRNCNGH